MTLQIDLDELANRVLAIRRGELPPDAVTDEELRAAIQAQRERFKAGAERVSAKKAATARPKTKAVSDFDFSNVSLGGSSDSSGSLF